MFIERIFLTFYLISLSLYFCLGINYMSILCYYYYITTSIISKKILLKYNRSTHILFDSFSHLIGCTRGQFIRFDYSIGYYMRTNDFLVYFVSYNFIGLYYIIKIKVLNK